MAAPPLNAAGVSKLTQQLRTASASTARVLSALEQLQAGVDEVQEQMESGLEELQSELEELRNEAEQQSEEALGAVRNLSETAAGGAEEHVPGASASLAVTATESESDHEALGQRLESITEQLDQEGFEGLSSELNTAHEENAAASGALAAGFSELDSGRSTAQGVIESAETEATAALAEATSSLEGEALSELESVADGKISELLSTGSTGQQEVEQLKGQTKEAYGGWAGEVESSCTDLLEKVVASVEETMQTLAQAQQEHLHEPCEQLLVDAMPKAQGGLETVANEGTKWGGGCDDLSRTTGDMEQAKDAKDAFDRAVG